jgi:uncharacterized protein YigA (DUF484 family)
MNADEVAQYLKDHPAFFEAHADLLAAVTVRHPLSGQVIPLAERQVITLRDRNRALESRQAELIRFGEENDLTLTRVHRLAVALVHARSREAVLGAIGEGLREDFSVPHVALRLWGQVRAGEGVENEPVSETLRAYAATLERPFCGVNGAAEPAGWFAVATEHIRSVAFVALRDQGETFGLLSLGSEDPGRFYPDMGTLYLGRIGDLIAAALVRTA